MRRRMSGEGRRASPGAKQRPGRAKPRRSAAGGAAGRSALGADGRRDGQINGTVIPLKIPPPEFPREFTPEFGGGGGRKMPPPRNLGLCYKPERTRGKIFAPLFLRSAGRMNSGGGEGEVWQWGGEQARSILKKTPVQNFQKIFWEFVSGLLHWSRRPHPPRKAPSGEGLARGGNARPVHSTRALRRGGTGAFGKFPTPDSAGRAGRAKVSGRKGK